MDYSAIKKSAEGYLPAMAEYEANLEKVLAVGPNLIVDDGGDLVHLMHTKFKDKLPGVLGSCEETTTGIIRLKQMAKAGTLRFPAVMNKLHSLCEEAFEDVIKDMNASYTVFLDKWGLPQERLPWQPKVRYFSEVYAEAERDDGAAFLEDYKAAYEKAKQGFRSKALSTVQAANLLIETTLKHGSQLV